MARQHNIKYHKEYMALEKAARKYIEKYTNSKEKIVKDLAKELIASWDN